jgi:O-succinylbenzoic acid--CoA ligase
MDGGMNTCRSSQRLTLGGRTCLPEEIAQRISLCTDERERNMLTELHDFLAEWFAPADTMTVCTSGSTGTPKPIEVSKERMMQSALATCKHLGLKRGDTALLCMPVRYIAGRMMVVRALVAGLNVVVVPPSGHPLSGVDTTIDFAAMIPLQVINSLGSDDERRRLFSLRKLIIGGGPVDDGLASALQAIPGQAYATYGMTETLSHIALRRINGPEASELYYPLPGVRLSMSADDTLVIDAPRVCPSVLTTNDVARMADDGGFVILGRRDNIINSGGIKIQAEEVERLLRSLLSQPFAVTSLPDERLGEAVTLLIEGEASACVEQAFDQLPRYWRPRHTISVTRLPLTATGKTDRAACRRLAMQLSGK